MISGFFGRKPWQAWLFLFCYILLAVAFLIEAAIPGDVSGAQSGAVSSALSGLFDDSAATLVTNYGTTLDTADLRFDVGRTDGSLVLLTPAVKNAVIEKLESSAPGVLEVGSVGSVYYLIARSNGRAKITATVSDGYTKKTKTCTLEVKPGISSTPDYRGIALSAARVARGETFTAHADVSGLVSGMASSCLTYESSDPSVVRVSSLRIAGGGATFVGYGTGTATVSAKRIDTGEVVGEATVEVTDAIINPELLADGCGTLDRAELFYDTEDGVGTLLRITPSGGTDYRFRVSDTEVVRILRHSYPDGAAYVLRVCGVGHTTVTFTATRSDGETVTAVYDLEVTEKDLRAPAKAPKLSAPVRVAVGRSIQLSAAFGDADPSTATAVFWSYANYEELELTDSNPTAASATFRARRVGTYEISAVRLSDYTVIGTQTVEVIDGTGTEILPVHTAVRKLVGHFLFCLALGVLCLLSHRFFVTDKTFRPLLIAVEGVSLAAISERIQAAVRGRDCSVADIGVDCAGFVAGVLLALLILRIVRRVRQKREEKNGA